jgi:hypothetical protein
VHDCVPRGAEVIATIVVATAFAAPPALVSETALYARPDAWGDPTVTVAERVDLDWAAGSGWALEGDGGLRLPPGDPTPRLDLWHLALRREWGGARLVLGRHERLDARGYQALDGGSLVVGGATEAEVWAGRTWDAEWWSRVDPWIAGARVETDLDTWALGAGLEGRVHGQDFAPRGFASASVTDLRGDRALLVAEASPEAWRGRADGTVALGRAVDVNAVARWEGLPPDRGPRTPMDFLAPEGYATGQLGLSKRAGGWSLHLRAGPTWNHSLGGAAHALAGSGPLAFGVETAAIGGSSLAGLTSSLGIGPTSLGFALYRLDPLDGDAGIVGEIRGRRSSGFSLGDLPLDLDVEVAASTDSTLALALRGGVLLRVGT